VIRKIQTKRMGLLLSYEPSIAQNYFKNELFMLLKVIS